MRFEWGCQALKNSCHRNQEQHVKNSMVRQLGRSRSDVFARILAHSPSRWRGAAKPRLIRRSWRRALGRARSASRVCSSGPASKNVVSAAAIGGGEIRTRGTADIDREIIRLSNKEHLKVLFIPTASSDSERYCRRFAGHFGEFLECKTDVLVLIDAPPSAKEIERKTFSADIVYVGGGIRYI